MSGKPNIMVSTTVYGFERDIAQICALLNELGYNVWNSHIGTIKVDPNLSNLENCIKAVENCDLFLGIIRTQCGTGNIGDKNITFEEMKKAIELKKPFWFLAHRDVVFARRLFKKMEHSENITFKDKKFFDPLCIKMYDYVIQSGNPVETRTGNWVQEFYRFDEIEKYLKTQFGEKDFVNYLMGKDNNNG